VGIDTTWVFDGDGNWTQSEKWSNGEPIDNSFNVHIDDGDSAVTVTLNASRTIGGLEIGMNDALRIEALSFPRVQLTVANGFVNDATIVLTGTSFGDPELAISNGSLVNSQTGSLLFQAGGT
jgi:hypothetical protein